VAEAADVAIVGGGLVGLVAAHVLAANGVSAIVLERGEAGGGATGRSAGLVLAGIADHASRLGHGVGRDEAAAVWRFSLENGVLIRELVAAHDIACGYDPCGSFAVAASPAEDRDLHESIELLEAEGVHGAAEYLDAAELARRPRRPRGLGAIRYRGDAALDGAALARGLAATLPGGARLRERTAVRAIDVRGDGVRLEVEKAPAAGGRAAKRGEVRAEVAVVAANAWAPEVAPFFEGLILPVRGQGFVTAPLPRLLDAGVSAGWGHELYRQRPDGRLVACGFRPDAAEEDMGTGGETSERFLGFLARFAAERIAGFPAAPPIEARFAAPCGMARDALPLVGPLPGAPRLLAACGFTMRGLSLGAAAGRAVARLVIDGVRDFPASFLPSRFL
jgi:glycine/D-amino acid oxidase-like deaminating enzyme